MKKFHMAFREEIINREEEIKDGQDITSDKVEEAVQKVTKIKDREGDDTA